MFPSRTRAAFAALLEVADAVLAFEADDEVAEHRAAGRMAGRPGQATREHHPAQPHQVEHPHRTALASQRRRRLSPDRQPAICSSPVTPGRARQAGPGTPGVQASRPEASSR